MSVVLRTHGATIDGALIAVKPVTISVDRDAVGPWADFLHYRTVYSEEDPELEPHRLWRDGRTGVRFGETAEGRGVDRIDVDCRRFSEEPHDGVTYWVRLEATTPDGHHRAVSEIAEIELRCDSDEESDEEVDTEARVRPVEQEPQAREFRPDPNRALVPSDEEIAAAMRAGDRSNVGCVAGLRTIGYALAIMALALVVAALRQKKPGGTHPGQE